MLLALELTMPYFLSLFQSAFFLLIKKVTGHGMHPCDPSYSGARGRRITVRDWPRQKYETLSEKQTKATRMGGMAEVVKCLPSKLEAPSSSPNTTHTHTKSNQQYAALHQQQPGTSRVYMSG
jgi:hypothetical protein